MPELPEVETVKRGLEPALVGARITRVQLARKNLRFPFPDRFQIRLQGRRVTHLSRRAKYLLIMLEGEEVLVIHFGMSGRLTLSPLYKSVSNKKTFETLPGDPKHDHVVFHLEKGARLTYNDPRRFGFMDLVNSDELSVHRLFKALGPEPLGNGFNAYHLARLAMGRKTDLKAFLLDQHTVAGLGNIYVCEALYRACLSPKRAANTLATKRRGPAKRAEVLVQAIRDVLNDAIVAGGSSLKDFKKPDGALGYFQHSFEVYGREGRKCRRQTCNGIVARITQAGRSTFYCPRCQH